MLGDIVKIVYFDEGSATDYCQIRSGGNVNMEAMASDSKAKGVEGAVGASISARLSGLMHLESWALDVTILSVA